MLPGVDPDDPDTDPILESNELKEGGDFRGARKILMDLLEHDLRCLLKRVDLIAGLRHLPLKRLLGIPIVGRSE